MGGGYSSVVKRSEISGTSLNHYLNGREMKTGTAIHLAEVCGVNPQWLIFGDGSETTQSGMIATVDWNRGGHKPARTIPGYDVELSAGHGFSPSSAIENVEFSIDEDVLPSELLSSGRRLVAVRARGDSMEPYICSGDVLVVDLSDLAIFTGGIYAIRVGDELLVKRLARRVNGNLGIISDNPRYPPDEIDADQAQHLFKDGGSPVAIIGRVVWRMGMTLS